MRACLYNLATDQYRGVAAGLAKAFLFSLSLIYRLAVSILARFYRRRQFCLNCKVISVGNITLGGTGKTSLVAFIAGFLHQQGHKVAILTRGYKTADEPRMLSKNLPEVPVIINPDRIQAAKQVIRDYGVDTVILDDGLQQWKIKKDLEIVAIDAANPFGNRQLLPRGILREPLGCLRRADIFILTKTNLKPDTAGIKRILNQINSGALVIETAHQPVGFYNLDKPQEVAPADALKGQEVTLFSGIGDPGSFEKIIAGLGIKAGLVFRFSDHYDYASADLGRIIRDSKNKGIDTLVTTEKDAARISRDKVAGQVCRILVLRIRIGIKENEQGFCDRLLKLYSG